MQTLVLVIDDEAPIRDRMTNVLQNAGYRVATAKNGRQGFARFTELRPQLVITDIIMPEQEGIETIMKMRAARPDVQIVAMDEPGSARQPDFLAIAMALGADAKLRKPIEPGILVDTVRQLTRRRVLLSWTDEMTIDEGVIDDDHRCLIGIINDFDAGRRRGDGLPATIATLSKLTAYTAGHFKREEALQTLIDYPDVDGQSRQHMSMVVRLRQLQSRLIGADGGGGDPAVVVDLAAFLSQWLARHIVHSDLLMRPFAKALRSAQEGMPPLEQPT